jgi:hypothetical protein
VLIELNQVKTYHTIDSSDMEYIIVFQEIGSNISFVEKYIQSDLDKHLLFHMQYVFIHSRTNDSIGCMLNES